MADANSNINIRSPMQQPDVEVQPAAAPNAVVQAHPPFSVPPSLALPKVDSIEFESLPKKRVKELTGTASKEEVKAYELLNSLVKSINQDQESLKYFLVLEEEAEPVKVTEFESRDKLVEALKALVGDPKPGMRILLFQGSRLFLTKGPYRYLMTSGDKIPLFTVPAEAEVDEDGYLMPEPKLYLKEPELSDEEFEEDEDLDPMDEDFNEDPNLEDDS